MGRCPGRRARAAWAPTRMRDVLWVGNSWGANLARIDIRTHETTYVPLPGQQQPYHVAVDRAHNAWTNLWGADRVLRYDPTTSAWTAFDLPTRGAEPRYVSLLEREGAADAGGASLFPGEEGRGHDAAQRSRLGCAQGGIALVARVPMK